MCVCVPVHFGVDGNEKVDKAEKKTLKTGRNIVNLNISISQKCKVVVRGQSKRYVRMNGKKISKGRYLLNNKPLVESAGSSGRNRKEERVMTGIRNGHTGLNSSLHVLIKHNNGKCDFCEEDEAVNHVLLFCQRYESVRGIFKKGLKEMGEGNIIIVQKKSFSEECWKILLEYLESTRLKTQPACRGFAECVHFE